MPAALGPLVGFALGVALAWWYGDGDAERGPIRRSTAVVALFAALVFAPINGYFLAFAGDWSFAYFLDSRAIPSALGLVLAVVDAALVVTGFAIARGRVRARAFGPVALLAVVPAGLSLLAVVALYPRLRVDATFHQFRSDFGTEPVAGGPLGYALLWMDSVLLAGMVLAARALSARSRIARRTAEIAASPAPGAPRPGRLGLGGRARPGRPAG